MSFMEFCAFFAAVRRRRVRFVLAGCTWLRPILQHYAQKIGKEKQGAATFRAVCRGDRQFAARPAPSPPTLGRRPASALVAAGKAFDDR